MNATTPYKGLMPYSEEDAQFFFGREPEREIITANLMASRLTLLYGASGVGKSSVLRAGVAYHLRQLAQQNLAARGTPEFAVVVFASWRDDPIAKLLTRVQESVEQAWGKSLPAVERGDQSFAQTLHVWAERAGGGLIVILDQFEEYFLYHAQEDGEGTFAVEFPRAVNRPDLNVSFLISTREDSLAKLDRFKGRIPNLFDNYLRIQHLDRDAARDAIVKPIEQYNRLHATEPPVSIEPALVDAVLDQVKAGQVFMGEAGRGIVAGATEARVETPYLQLVMTRLWDAERRAGSQTLKLETLNRLGGAERIVRTHLDAAMSALPAADQDVAARVFRFLVTPSGAKIAHTAPDLAAYADLPPPRVNPCLEKLASGSARILRTVAPPPEQPQVARYEIFHDVLAPAILDWRERYLGQARRKQIVQRVVTALALPVLIVLGLMFLYAQAGWSVAQQAQVAATQAQTSVIQARVTAAQAQVTAAQALDVAQNAVATTTRVQADLTKAVAIATVAQADATRAIATAQRVQAEATQVRATATAAAQKVVPCAAPSKNPTFAYRLASEIRPTPTAAPGPGAPQIVVATATPVLGGIFFQNNVAVEIVSGDAVVCLSSSRDGPAALRVDDYLEVTVVHKDKSSSNWVYDFFDAKTNSIVAIAAPDVSRLFVTGRNEVRLTLRDLRAQSRSAAEIWLLVWQGTPAAPTRVLPATPRP